MAVCKFFLQGNCRNGANCRFEHPEDKPVGYNRPRNQFEVLNRDSPGHGRGYNQFDNSPAARKFGEDIPTNKYKLDPEVIKKDLTADRPVYIFSCYAPSRDVPVNLFGGQPREQSFEEQRLHYYQLDAQGKALEARGQEDALRVSAEQQIQAALNDVQGAIRYVREAETKHPNRIDVVEGRARNEDQAGFGGDSARQCGAFGRLDVAPNAGNPFGGQSVPKNPFGGPQQAAPSNPFQQAKPANPFGRPQQPTFGTTSFGPPVAQSGLGQPAQPERPAGPFDPGAPQNPFNRTGAGAQFSPPDSPFKAPPGNPFAGGSQTLFAPAKTYEPSTAATNAFGATKFEQASQPAVNPFAAAAGAGSKPNPFANPGGFAPNGANKTAPQNVFPPPDQKYGGNPFNANKGDNAGQQQQQPLQQPPQDQGRQMSIHGNEYINNPAERRYGAPTHVDEQPIRREGDVFVVNIPGEGRREMRDLPAKVLTSFKGEKVHLHCSITSKNIVGSKEMSYAYWPYYYDQNGKRKRIWQQEPKDWKGKVADDPPGEVYDLELRRALLFLREHHKFKDGVMPPFPPPQADTNYDI